MKLNKILHNVEYDGKHNNQDITYITHDSRRVKKGTLYIALKGLSCDGHDYIFDAIEKGAVAIIANGRAPDTNIVPIIQVKNPRKTMSIIAANFFDNPSFNVFSSSGSKNGGFPDAIILHFSLSVSMPIVEISFEANTLERDSPTNPSPTIPTLILVSTIFYKNHALLKVIFCDCLNDSTVPTSISSSFLFNVI